MMTLQPHLSFYYRAITDNPMGTHNRIWHTFETIEKESYICKDTGVTITTYTMWEDVPLTDNYSASYRKINDSMILIIPRGLAKEHDMTMLFDAREYFLKGIGFEDKRFVELKDYKYITATPSKGARIIFKESLLKDERRVVAFIGFNSSKAIKIIFNIGVRISSTSILGGIVDTFTEAIDAAHKELHNDYQNKMTEYGKDYFTKFNWRYEHSNGSIRGGVFEKNIISFTLTGTLNKDSIDIIESIFTEIIHFVHYDSFEFESYIICNFVNVSIENYKAFGHLLKLMQKQVNDKVALINVPLLTQGGLLRLYYFNDKPYKLFSRNHDAYVYISTIRQTKGENTQKKILQKASHDIVNYLSFISWDNANSTLMPIIPDDHPFRRIFEEIALVKFDLDSLLQEQKIREEELEHAKENLEELNVELSKAKDFLEYTVEERTRDLEESNKVLREQKKEIEELNNILNEKLTKHKDKLKSVELELIKENYKSELADITTGALHNVKNILNSVKTSADVLSQFLHGVSINGVIKALGLLLENKEHLDDFFTERKGRKLLDYMNRISEQLLLDVNHCDTAYRRFCDKIQMVEEIISVQQGYGGRDIIEEIPLIKIVNDALTMQNESVVHHNLDIHINIPNDYAVCVKRTKFMHILINMIKNAKEAMEGIPSDEKIINFTAALEEQYVTLVISDNGCGISKENLDKIFQHGFTTKDQGHGFGLHSSFVYMKEMGGTLSVESDGIGKGTTFKFEIPKYTED